MKVAIYCDTDAHKGCVEAAIRSVREHMDCPVVHLTTPDGPQVGADERLELDIDGAFGYRRAILSAQVEGDVLFMDSDVLCNADVSDVFEQDFDVAIATDVKPGKPDIKYNAGVIFSRCPGFWLELAGMLKDADFGHGEDWYPLEKAPMDLVDSGRYKTVILPGEQYNYIPEDAKDRQGKLTHFRGNRKAWIPHPIEFISGLNTAPVVMMGQLIVNLERGLPVLEESEPHDRTAVIVGGGPSLEDNLDKLEGDIFALGNVHDYLIERDIIPRYHVMLDARPQNAEFVRHPHKSTKYLIAGVCHPSVFDALKGYSVTLWIPDMEGLESMNRLRVGGGATVGMKAMYLAYLMGYRKFVFVGFDSSYRNGTNHAYEQPLNNGEGVIEVVAAGQTFQCAPWMAKQAQEFQQQARKLTDLGCKLTVHGSGLIPWIVQHQSTLR